MITSEFSVFDLVTMVAVLVLAVLYMTILLKLKPSTENKDQHKKDSLPEKRKPPPNGLVFVNSLKTKENTALPQRTQNQISPQKIQHPITKTALPQRTQNQISPQKIQHPITKTTRTSTSRDKSQAPPKLEVSIENKPSNSHCAHHFGYLRKLPKNTPIPRECLGCSQVVECMITLKFEKKLVK